MCSELTWLASKSFPALFPSHCSSEVDVDVNSLVDITVNTLGYRPLVLDLIASELKESDSLTNVTFDFALSELMLNDLLDDAHQDDHDEDDHLGRLWGLISEQLKVNNVDELHHYVATHSNALQSLQSRLVLNSDCGQFSSQSWDRFQSLANRMNTEFEQRRTTLLTRLDATLKAFFWKNAVDPSNKKRGVNNLNSMLIDPKEVQIAPPLPIRLAQVLSLTKDELVLCSDKRLRSEKGTRQPRQTDQDCLDVRRVRVGAVPDRGGRTREMEAPAKEMPAWQTRRVDAQGHQGRGGYGRGGHGRNRDQQGQQRQYGKGRVQGGGWQRR